MKKTGKRKLKTILLIVSSFMVLLLCFSLIGNINTKEEAEETINGKTISFLGDSISTYEGYSNNSTYNTTIGDNAVWYNSAKLSSVNDTYWMTTINDLELELCVNNSWSGSEVCTYYDETSAGCMNRSYNLHNDNSNEFPDIIVVYIGINDYYSVESFGEYNSISDIYNKTTKSYLLDTTSFAPAYATMMHKIVNKYSKSDIYCMNLLPIGATKETVKLSKYNDMIKKIASDFNVKYIDLFKESGITVSNITTYTFDGTHPTKNGHKLIADCLKKNLLKNYKLTE